MYATETTFALIVIMSRAGGIETSGLTVPNGRVTIVHLMIVSIASLSKTTSKNTGNPGYESDLDR